MFSLKILRGKLMPGRPKNDPLAHALRLTAVFWRAAGEDLLTHTRGLTAVFIFNKQRETPFK